MKKNLLSVLILVLLIVNIALSAIVMTSVISTNQKTADLITSIATVMNLELYNPGGEAITDIPMSETATYDMTGTLTIPLTVETVVDENGVQQNGKQVYIVFNMSLFMNTKHEDYKTYGETIGDRQSAILDTVTSVISSHTETECHEDFDEIREEVLDAIQDLFKSDFIYKVGISNIKYG